MTAKESESEAALEIAVETYVAGTDRALREFVTARYAASLLKNPEEARKAQDAAREARSRVEAHLKGEFDKACDFISRNHPKESPESSDGHLEAGSDEFNAIPAATEFT